MNKECSAEVREITAINRFIVGFAGFFIMLSVALSHFHNPNWLYFTLFVGANLFQSAFTKFCPLVLILKKFGVGR